MDSDKVVLYGVGDIAPYRENPHTIFDKVRDSIHKADISICQLEINITNRGTPLPQARLAMRANRETAKAIKDAGFTIVSFASNHCLDWGNEGLLDTIEALKEQGLHVIGVGANIQEARKPAIIERKGIKLAFLSYNSILPQGYWAEGDRPGCAPLRAFTFYEQIEHDQPGTPCRIHTFANKADLKAMLDDIQKAKQVADHVVLSLHWGIHFIPAIIADYQKEIGYIAINNDVSLILGHHAHILKGIDVYCNKVIFYSLCNFAIDLAPTKEMLERPRHKEIEVLNPDWQPDPEYPTYYMPKDSRKTIVAKAVFSKKKVEQVSFLPTYINKQSQPEILTSNDERFKEVIKYIEEMSKNQNLNVRLSVVNNEVIINSP